MSSSKDYVKPSLGEIAGVAGYLESLIHSRLGGPPTALAKIAEITKYFEVRQSRIKLGEDLSKWFRGKLTTKTLCARYSEIIGDEMDVILVTAMIHAQLTSEEVVMRMEYNVLREMTKAISEFEKNKEKIIPALLQETL